MVVRMGLASPSRDDDPLLGAGRTRAAVELGGVRLPEAELTADLVVPAKSLCIVSGDAGAGKTAVMDVLRLARLPRDGDIRILEDDPRRLRGDKLAALRRRIGALQQQPRLFEHMSARDNVCVPLRLAGRDEREFSSDIAQLCAFVGLDEGDARPAFALSETARRRVALARALVLRPDLIVADEPAAGMGPEAAGRLIKALFAMPRAGAAVVIATQDESLADAAPEAGFVRLERGRMILLRPPRPMG